MHTQHSDSSHRASISIHLEKIPRTAPHPTTKTFPAAYFPLPSTSTPPPRLPAPVLGSRLNPLSKAPFTVPALPLSPEEQHLVTHFHSETSFQHTWQQRASEAQPAGVGGRGGGKLGCGGGGWREREMWDGSFSSPTPGSEQPGRHSPRLREGPPGSTCLPPPPKVQRFGTERVCRNLGCHFQPPNAAEKPPSPQ